MPTTIRTTAIANRTLSTGPRSGSTYDCLALSLATQASFTHAPPSDTDRRPSQVAGYLSRHAAATPPSPGVAPGDTGRRAAQRRAVRGQRPQQRGHRPAAGSLHRPRLAGPVRRQPGGRLPAADLPA